MLVFHLFTNHFSPIFLESIAGGSIECSQCQVCALTCFLFLSAPTNAAAAGRNTCTRQRHNTQAVSKIESYIYSIYIASKYLLLRPRQFSASRLHRCFGHVYDSYHYHCSLHDHEPRRWGATHATMTTEHYTLYDIGHPGLTPSVFSFAPAAAAYSVSMFRHTRFLSISPHHHHRRGASHITYTRQNPNDMTRGLCICLHAKVLRQYLLLHPRQSSVSMFRHTRFLLAPTTARRHTYAYTRRQNPKDMARGLCLIANYCVSICSCSCARGNLAFLFSDTRASY